jgi:hypothetical protein
MSITAENTWTKMLGERARSRRRSFALDGTVRRLHRLRHTAVASCPSAAHGRFEPRPPGKRYLLPSDSISGQQRKQQRLGVLCIDSNRPQLPCIQALHFQMMRLFGDTP